MSQILNKVLTIDPQLEQLTRLVTQAQNQGQSIKSTVLVTGGAGYIGSHVVRQLIKDGYDVIILDNLSTGKAENLDTKAKFVQGDLLDLSILNRIFLEHKINAVIHLAASIEVGESVEKPDWYLKNNAVATQNLLSVMHNAAVNNIIFSSTAAVYGIQKDMPINESALTNPLDPYGYSKLICEKIIEYYTKFTPLNAVIFRYFNACGSDFDKTIYSSHKSHLLTQLNEVASGNLPYLNILGDDYSTPDGTGIRDYVHVLDIARAHSAVLPKMEQLKHQIFNIGASSGYSVKQILSATEKFLGKVIPVQISPRREGDATITVADNSKISQILGFELKYSDLDTILSTSLH